MLQAITTGLVHGARHVIAGPDHLAAVLPLAVERRSGTWRVGLAWGFGHAASVLLLAGAALGSASLLGETLLARVSAWSEALVGFVLVGLGLRGLYKAARTEVHVHAHEHDGKAHVHLHEHLRGRDHDARRAHGHAHGPFAIGTLHGLAGSAHLVGALPVLALPSLGLRIAYLLTYALASVGVMVGIAWLCGRSLEPVVAAGPALYRRVQATAALLAIGVGGWWIACIER